MGRLWFGMVLAIASAFAANPAAGQGGGGCVVVDIADGGYARQLAGPGGSRILFVSGPVEIHCGGGIIVEADSAHSLGNELRLIRNVFYQDSAQIMTATTANYFRAEGRLIARDDVEVRDRYGPSVVRGNELQYDKVMPGRPEARIVMRGRPRAYLYEEGTPPLPEGMVPSPGMRVVGGDTIPAALQVDAERLELAGENRILAHGRVQMIREDLRAFADAADYDRAAGTMDLTGNARIEGEGYELFGDRITANMPDEELDRVVSSGSAQLIGEDIRVHAPVIDIALADGDVERMIAVTRDATTMRASAVARDFSLLADSIQADAPGDAIERIVAVGDAYGERTADSTQADLPELVRSDWLRGDTIVGTFVVIEAGEAEGDSARTTLETLTATGTLSPARSLYRMASTDSESDRPAVNYMVASRIAIRFSDGEVSHVRADGPVEGLHLEPVPPAAPPQAEPDDDEAPAAPADTTPDDGPGPEAAR